MAQCLRLYWLRETGCDLGTQVGLDDLDETVREQVMELAPDDDREITLHLPFFDRRESRRRTEALRTLRLVREGDVIRSVPATPAAGIRDHAAMLLAAHPAWKKAADEFDARYFPTWQGVSLALQKALRVWIPESYFRDPSRYEDRDMAYPLIVYAASRPCHGRARMEFTYDVADPELLPCATKMIGRALQSALESVERRLHEEGFPELARRYAPVWYEDVLRAVMKTPRRLISLLGQEAALVNAVIDLGTTRRMEAVKPFARATTLALRKLYGEDMRQLAPRILEKATETLAAPVQIK
jgi:hypothetical protein